MVEIQTYVKTSSGGTIGMLGTGFFIDKECHILTAAHVVYDDEDLMEGIKDNSRESVKSLRQEAKVYKYWVVINNKKYGASFVGSNRYVDAAIIKLDNPPAEGCSPAVLGNSDNVKVGELVVVIGSPVGLTNSVSAGIVSALHRMENDGLWFIEDFIQTDAPINPGNSGGPLINEKGEVIGIVDAGIRNTDGLSFAVPINLATEFLERMKKEGNIKIGLFGAETLVVNFARSGGFEDIKYLNNLIGWDNLNDLALLNEVSKNKSAVVIKLLKDSPAQKAGLKLGDIIVEFNGYAVKNVLDLRIAMLKTEKDKEIAVKVIRIANGKQEELSFSVKLLDPDVMKKKITEQIGH